MGGGDDYAGKMAIEALNLITSFTLYDLELDSGKYLEELATYPTLKRILYGVNKRTGKEVWESDRRFRKRFFIEITKCYKSFMDSEAF
jgi:hypothetical protein